MEDIAIFKPVWWRLLIWKLLPTYIGIAIAALMIRLIEGYFSNLLLEIAILNLVMILVSSVIFRKQFDIVITDNTVSGQGVGALIGRVTFPIADVDLSRLRTQTLYEKISFFHSIQSRADRRIMVADFIYGKNTVTKLYEILEKQNLESASK